MDHVHKAVIGPGFGLNSPLKRKPSSCGVCRLRFNSEVQASSHYSGTKHAKRLKALDTPDSKIRTSEPVAKETISHILPSPCSQSSSAETTSGEEKTSDHFQFAVNLKKVDEMAGALSEDYCGKQSQLASLRGEINEPSAPNSTSEAAPLSSSPTETVKVPPETSLSPSPKAAERETLRDGDMGVAPEEETEEEKAMRLLYCSLCKVAVNSASQLQAHNSGTKHKTMLEARSGDGAIKSFPRTGVKAKLCAPSELSTGLQNKTFHCEICDVHVNSETQLKQHISSRRHKDRAAGKPAKPKFSPYTPTQRHQSFQAIRLALRKNQDLTKPLASCLLQRQLSVAAAAAMATLPPFPLRPASNSNPGLFQSQALPQALLHPAPGPICSTHTPVLFSPY